MPFLALPLSFCQRPMSLRVVLQPLPHERHRETWRQRLKVALQRRAGRSNGGGGNALPLPCVFTVFVAKTLPLPCVFTVFVAKTAPFLAVRRCLWHHWWLSGPSLRRLSDPGGGVHLTGMVLLRARQGKPSAHLQKRWWICGLAGVLKVVLASRHGAAAGRLPAAVREIVSVTQTRFAPKDITAFFLHFCCRAAKD